MYDNIVYLDLVRHFNLKLHTVIVQRKMTPEDALHDVI